MSNHEWTLPVREYRRAIQQAFYGLVSLRPTHDTVYRDAIRTEIVELVKDLSLTIVGERGELLTGELVDQLAAQALDEVMTVSTAAPEEA